MKLKLKRKVKNIIYDTYHGFPACITEYANGYDYFLVIDDKEINITNKINPSMYIRFYSNQKPIADFEFKTGEKFENIEVICDDYKIITLDKQVKEEKFPIYTPPRYPNPSTNPDEV